MKKVLIFLALFMFWAGTSHAVVQNIATERGEFLVQLWNINNWYSHKIVLQHFSTAFVMRIKDINWNEIVNHQVAVWQQTSFNSSRFWKMIDMNNWKYIFIIEYAPWKTSLVLYDYLNNTFDDISPKTEIQKIFLKWDSSWNLYIVFMWAANQFIYLYNLQTFWFNQCYNSCNWTNPPSFTLSDLQNHGDDIDFTSTTNDFFELNYINGALFYTDIVGELSVLQVSGTTGNSLNFWPLNNLSWDFNGFVSEHTQFYVDSLDIANNTVKITSSKYDDWVYIYEYSLQDQTLTEIWTATDEFFVWFFDWSFQSVPFTADILQNADVSKQEAFLWFIEVNGSMLITAYDTVEGAWIIDDEFVPITYTSNEVFAGSVSGTWGGCSGTWCITWTGSTSYDSWIWNFDIDGDGDVWILNGEIFQWIWNAIAYFFQKIIDFFANVRDFITRILDVFTTEEKTFTFNFIPWAHAVDTSIINSVINDNERDDTQEPNIFDNIETFIYWFIYFLLFLFWILAYIHITDNKKND